MAKISNSFHSSSGKHSISDTSKLSKVQSHNDRGYFSWEYDQSKIHHLIGNENTLVEDVKNYINTKFNPEIEKSNARQKQACRRIKTDAYTHFCENKKLDIANEIIFQVADKEYWNRFRELKIVEKNKKKYILKSYPESLKDVMDKIFKRQACAYEHIYETHGSVILEKIKEAHRVAEEYLSNIEKEKKERFETIVKMKPKERKSQLAAMSDIEREEYASFFDAYETKIAIEKKNLIERIATGKIEIKLINMTAHYDEWSPHAHGISVCSASGYKTGLSSRVAKSVVLNRYALEVIQDRMREIAQEEMDKHPEIFKGTQLSPKEKGRTLHYETEEWIRMKQADLVEQVTTLTGKVQELEQKVTDTEKDAEEKIKQAEQKAKDAQRLADERLVQLKARERQFIQDANKRIKNARTDAEEQEQLLAAKKQEVEEQEQLIAGKKKEVEEWDKILDEVGDEKDYIEESDKAYNIINTLQDLLSQLVNRISPMRDKHLEQSLSDAFKAFYEALTSSIKKMRMYEVRERLPEELCKSVPLTEAKRSLDEKIDIANKKNKNEEPSISKKLMEKDMTL